MNLVHLSMQFAFRIDHKCSVIVLEFTLSDIMFPGDGADGVHFTLQTLLLDKFQGL